MKKFLSIFLAAAWVFAAPATVQAQAVTQWSQMMGGPSHNSYAVDPAITASNANTFGVKWMAHLFAADLGSPVVAYNTTLGKEVVYVGNERGDLYAVDANTGQEIWSTNFGVGVAERDTPAVAPDGSVWIGTNFSSTMYKVNGANGQVLCSIKAPNSHPIMGSPMIVTPKGGSETVYWDSVDGGVNGPLVSTNEATCAQNFDVTVSAGSWTTPSYAVDGAGEPLALIGTADPGCTENAYDAITGKMIWSDFLATNKPCIADVGDAASISPPGNNGFADGVDYVADDGGIEYALDLNTGAILWQYATVQKVAGQPCGYPNTGCGRQIATLALDGTDLVYGFYNGVDAINALNGNLIWTWAAPAGVDSSPAIIGPKGNEVVALADLTGAFRVFSLASGSQEYTYQTGGYISASPAEYNGMVYITSADGYLYAFGAGGSNGSAGSETIASPSGGTVSNPDGPLTISGAAADSKSVKSVEIAIQEGGSSGLWYDGATNTWNSAPFRNLATLVSPGAANTNWSFALPIPPSGSNYMVEANTVNSSNIVDKGSVESFSVSASPDEPTIKTSLFDVAPGGTFTASGNAFRPGETATFTLFGTAVATATVGKTGNVPQTAIGVPIDATFGPTSLTVTGGTSGKSASTQVYISNAWTQAGYGPQRTGMEPNDYVINHTIFVGSSVLNPTWMYPSGAAINTTPAVKDGIAYFGNDAGTLSAVTVSSGVAAWTYTIPSGQPIRSSPVVDDDGRLVFGANDSKLYVLSPTGSLLNTLTLSGDLGAPAYANNNIVIESNGGALYSISETNWATNWSISTGATPSVPVAYDAPNGFVIVGNTSGSVVAYESATGVRKWSAATGGAINGLSIVGGQVLVGSADGHVYAYNEKTGALNWSEVSGDGSAVTTLDANGGGPAWGTASGSMYEASSKGNMYYSKKYTTGAVIGIAGAGTDEFGAYATGDLGMLRSADGGWFYSSGAKYGVGPVILNGILFQGAQNGNMVAFTTGTLPIPPQQSIRVGAAVVIIDGTGQTCP